MNAATIKARLQRISHEALESDTARLRREMARCKTQEGYNEIRELLDLHEAEAARREV